MNSITDIQLDTPKLDTKTLDSMGDTAGSAAGGGLGNIFEGSNINMWGQLINQVGGWIDYGIQSHKIAKAQRAQNLYMANTNRAYNPWAYQSTDSIFGGCAGSSQVGNLNGNLAAKYREGSLFS